MTPSTSSSTTWPTSAGAAPLFATPRNPDAPNEGGEIAVVAKSLGTPLIPWQQYAADVGTELRPDGSYEYEIVIVAVPRQTGKTTLIRAVGVHSAAVLGLDFHYTAQTGKDARARWLDLVEACRKSMTWKARHWVTLRQGAEACHFHHKNGPAFRCFAPVDDALHGYTPPRVCLDEAFAHDKAKGDLLMGAIEPAQQTLKKKQLWIVSTMGTDESVFLHEWIKRAMAGMPRVACFYWGAPDDDAPFSIEGIKAYHPGVGFTLNEVVLEAESILAKSTRMPRSEYIRAFGNRKTLTKDNLIPGDVWVALKAELDPPDDTRDLTLSYDVSYDRRGASIIATWLTPDGLVAGKVVQASEGTSWLATAVDGLAKAWRPAAVVAVGHGPVLDVTAQLTDRGVHVTVLNERDYAAACSALLARIEDKRLTHDGGPVLASSVTGLAARRGAVDGLAFSRRDSVGDSSAGIALAAGLWTTERRAHDRKPVLEFG